MLFKDAIAVPADISAIDANVQADNTNALAAIVVAALADAIPYDAIVMAVAVAAKPPAVIIIATAQTATIPAAIAQ